MIPWHLGAVHPFEQVLTLVLAFGPFLVLGIVILVRRRMDRVVEERDGGAFHRITGESDRSGMKLRTRTGRFTT